MPAALSLRWSVCVCPLLTENVPDPTVTVLMVFLGFGFGLVFFLVAVADTATADLPSEVTFVVSVIGPEHTFVAVPPLQATPRVSAGPVVEVLVIDVATACSVVNVPSALT